MYRYRGSKLVCALVVFFCYSIGMVSGQYDFEVLYTKVNEQTNKLVLGFEVLENERHLEVNSTQITITEKIGSKFHELAIDRIIEPESDGREAVTIVFLIDISGSMRGERIEKAKQAIIQTISSSSLPQNSKVFISTFDNDISDNVEITPSNVQEIVDPIDQKGKDTDLYRATIQKIREAQDLPGKRILIALSDGKNDTGRNPYYNSNPRPTSEDVYTAASETDSNFFLFPVALGSKAEIDFLEQSVAMTPNPMDSVLRADNPDFLSDIFFNLVSDFTGIYQIHVIPKERIYMGEPRSLLVSWGSKTKPHEYRAGAVNNEVDLRYKTRSAELNHWISVFAIGFSFILLSLIGFSFVRPWFEDRKFKKLYVKPYVTEPNRIRYDPITQDEIKAGDQVVYKCQQVTLFSTWKNLGHCPSYPSCTDFINPCDGAGAGEGEKKFFQQKGLDKLFNWLWFGGLGGFLAWIFYALSKYLGLDWLRAKVHYLFSTEALSSWVSRIKDSSDVVNNLDTLTADATTGLFLGTSIVLTLSLAMELGDSRSRSWWRVLSRPLLSIFLFVPLFTAGFFLQYALIGFPYPSGIITWSLFGVLLGLMISLRSNVSNIRAILGGFVGAIVAYHIYFGISHFMSDFALAKLISFILIGVILGAIMVTIVSSLEDFYLVVRSPSQFRGMVKPISKWLKKGMEVYIGSLSKCYVFIKWSDEEVEGRHAVLTHGEDAVYIEPIGETLLNGVILPMNEKTPLKDEDIIRLGRSSFTQLEYKEKRSS